MPLDSQFQRLLVASMLRDSRLVEQVQSLMDGQWSTSTGEQKELWWIAQQASEYYAEYGDALGKLAPVEIKERADVMGWAADRRDKYVALTKALLAEDGLPSGKALMVQLRKWWKHRVTGQFIDRLIDARETGDMEQLEVQCREMVFKLNQSEIVVIDYLAGIEQRIKRRGQWGGQKPPAFYIDPLDELVNGIFPGQIGLLLAPYGRGKSLALIWLAIALLIQGYTVLYYTLEDPKRMVEDRFDAAITEIELSELAHSSNIIRERFNYFRSILSTKLLIVDGTEHRLSVADMRQISDRETARGIKSNVKIIDYDEEIRPSRKRDKTYEESDDIYRELREWMAQDNSQGWVAAQTTRGTEERKLIKGDSAAKDIGKMKKAKLTIGIGAGDWGNDSRYLYIAKANEQISHIGCNIMCKLEKGLFYDRDATLLKLQQEQQEAALNGGL